jgi:hypothetical protein
MRITRTRLPVLLALLFAAGLGTGVALERTVKPQSMAPSAAHDPSASEAALARGGLTPAEQLSLMQAIAQMHLQRKDYPNAIAWALRYVKSGGAESDVRPLLAHAHFQLGDYANAARELQWEIQTADRAGRALAKTGC